MIVVMQSGTPAEVLTAFVEHLEERGTKVTILRTSPSILYLSGQEPDEDNLRANEWVSSVKTVDVPYRLACRELHPDDTVVDVSGIAIGQGRPIAVIGGPCAVEAEDMVLRIAKEVHSAGASLLRGGAYKPRTSPYAFQGMGKAGLVALKKAGEAVGMPVVSEIMSASQLDDFLDNVDLLQIGARNMQNFDLLKAVGRTRKPILLKRGMAATIEEWIMSAEYILAEGNPNVILCERGIRTFETATRNTMDLAVIPIIKEKTHLPIVIDPSHACGDWRYVEAVAMAAVAAGCDGLMIEVHDDPEKARSDGGQSLKPERFQTLMEKARKVAHAIGREM